jgi:NAD(P)-dependent dehydrogenase (short-subunit alcohol dehydrogenase family)
MRFGLNGRHAVVTEATEQIGLAVVRALVEEGVHVIAGAPGPSAELDELSATGFVDVVLVDLCEIDWPTTLVRRAGGQLDILINNLGVATVYIDGSVEVTDDLWWRSLGLNLIAAGRATRAALPVMLAGRRGAIVNVGYRHLALPDYCAAHSAAMADLAESLSEDVSGCAVRVNSVSTAASGSCAQLDKVADLVTFLSSDHAANIAGADFTVGGDLLPAAEADSSSQLTEAADRGRA